MNYFDILNFKKEPFSNSPDPEFFFGSGQHSECLHLLEISVRLKRGLNLVTGDVGTGKTTLCRQLIRRFNDKDKIDLFLVLDPDFSSRLVFLQHLYDLFYAGENQDKRLPGSTAKGEADNDGYYYKEKIRQYLFTQGVDRQRTIVLIIDEGQKMPLFCVELLRDFLNYETNQHKLLQILVFGQEELNAKLANAKNFTDRINLYFHLKPLNFRETRGFIHKRLKEAAKHEQRVPRFSFAAIWTIHSASRGYPRQIITLCHKALLAMIVQNKKRVGLKTARACAARSYEKTGKTPMPAVFAAGLVCILVILALVFLMPRLKNSAGLEKVLFQVTKEIPPRGESNRAKKTGEASKPDEKRNYADTVDRRAIPSATELEKLKK